MAGERDGWIGETRRKGTEKPRISTPAHLTHIGQGEGRLTRCELSANIFKLSTASGLSGQWKTKKPAKVRLDSTSSRVILLIYIPSQSRD